MKKDITEEVCKLKKINRKEIILITLKLDSYFTVQVEISVVYPPVELLIATDCFLQFKLSYSVSVKLCLFQYVDYPTKGEEIIQLNCLLLNTKLFPT